MTPAEHLCLPDADDVRQGLIATRIAAHAADIAKGVPGARDVDDRMADARRRLAWDEMWDHALDADTARARYEASPASTEGTCTMCGRCAPSAPSTRSSRAPRSTSTPNRFRERTPS